MSSFLSKSFDALKIATPPQTGVSTRRRPFKLVRPKRQPHVQYYGYAVSPEWMVQFAEQHWPEALPDRHDKSYEDVAMTRAFELIRNWIPLYTLDSKDCFNPKGGVVPPEWFDPVDFHEEPEGFDMVHVLAVCSDQDDAFERRPTQEKLDFITNLIGHAPKWWVSCGYAD